MSHLVLGARAVAADHVRLWYALGGIGVVARVAHAVPRESVTEMLMWQF